MATGLSPMCSEPEMSVTSSPSSLTCFAVFTDHSREKPFTDQTGNCGSDEIVVIMRLPHIFYSTGSLYHHVVSLKEKQCIIRLKRRGQNKLKINFETIF